MSKQPGSFILDNKGRQYRLRVVDEDDLFLVKLEHQNAEVGRAICSFPSPDEMLLVDIFVDDAVAHRWQDFGNASHQYWRDLLRTVFKQTINYRRRGLGTAMLKFVINHARKKRVRQISGKIASQDLVKNPNLILWYKKHGFKLGDLLPEEQPHTVAKIYKNMG